MTAAADPEDEAPPKKKRSRLPMLLGLVLMLLGAAGGFYAVRSGLIGGAAPAAEEEAHVDPAALPELSPATYLALDPILVNLPAASGRDFLRFVAQLEVVPAHLEEVTAVKPRIVDVMNGYLRAIDLSDLDDPSALTRIRAQLLRRVQVVTGEGRVRDLLVMEFVLN